MTGRDEMCENSNILQGVTFDCTIAQYGETRSYVLEAEVEMDASQTGNKKSVGSYLVKFKLKLSNQMEMKTKQNKVEIEGKTD